MNLVSLKTLYLCLAALLAACAPDQPFQQATSEKQRTTSPPDDDGSTEATEEDQETDESEYDSTRIDDPEALDPSRVRTIQKNSVSIMEGATESPQIVTHEGAVGFDADEASLPENISGAYLTCKHTSGNQGPVSAEIGCHLMKDEQPITTQLLWSIAKKSGDQTKITLSEDPSEQFGSLISFQAKSTKELTETLKTSTINVRASETGAPVQSSPLNALTQTYGHICGDTGNSCYDHEAAMTSGTAYTPLGKSLEYVGLGFKSFSIWKEVDGNRVLKANGMDEWATKLNLNGKGHSSQAFTQADAIAGRVCPAHVYIDDSQKLTEGNCLYYTRRFGSQHSQAAGSSQTNASTLGLQYWRLYTSGDSDSRWYVGNVKTCGDLGMRLPTVFETQTTTTSNSNYPTNDGIPSFARTNGVPGSGKIWTATSYANSGNISKGWTNGYFTWDGTSVGWSWSSDPAFVKCVLP